MTLRDPAISAILEPIPVTDCFLTGIKVEDCGDHMRVVGYSDRPVHGGTERTIVVRVVLTKINFHRAVTDAMKAIGVGTH